MTTEIDIQDLFERYQHEMAGNYGFGATDLWPSGPRSFVAFLDYLKRKNELENIP